MNYFERLRPGDPSVFFFRGIFQFFSACCPRCGGNVFNVNNADATCVDCPSSPQAIFSEDEQ